jgi:hypothetical protein
MAVTAAAFALLAVAAAPAAGNAAPQKVERLPIVDRAIAHHGGDLYSASETELDLCSLSGCFHLVVRIDGGLYEYDVRGEVRGVERRVRVTNESVEQWERGEPVELGAEEERRARNFADARVYFPFLPYRLNDPSVYKQDLGLERWGDRELHKVKVTFEAGSSNAADDEYLYWFDPETARLEQFAYSFAGDPGGLRFRRGRDYRRVGGILFSDQDNLGLDENGLTVDQVTPELVAERMRAISEVVLRDLEVRPLDDDSGGD